LKSGAKENRDLKARVGNLVAIKSAMSELAGANNALAASNQELEAFSSSVSHDLRAPLRAIDGFARALTEDDFERLSDVGRQHLERIRGACGRMNQLIEDLLGLALVAREELRPTVVDLGALAQSIGRDLQRTRPELQIALRIEQNLNAKADANLLRIVLENLLANAWKFTRKREAPVIKIGSDQNNSPRAFFVRDNGAGFDMAHADRLFTASQRLHTQSDFGGRALAWPPSGVLSIGTGDGRGPRASREPGRRSILRCRNSQCSDRVCGPAGAGKGGGCTEGAIVGCKWFIWLLWSTRWSWLIMAGQPPC
jgi:light-regulated signal transduction histidine kinase (bacteriophytochrome)